MATQSTAGLFGNILRAKQPSLRSASRSQHYTPLALQCIPDSPPNAYRHVKMHTTLGFETGALTAVRFLLFFGCRKYLLRILYSDLQNLSSSDGQRLRRPKSPLGESVGEIELQTLPAPSTHTPKSTSFSFKDPTALVSTISRGLFSWCFAECCIMFLLLIFQAVNRFSPEGRLLNWNFSLYFLMVAIIILVPLSLSLVFSLGSTEGRSFRTVRGAFAFIPVGIYLFGLSYIPLPVGLEGISFGTATLARLIVLGTVFLGLLAGFAAVNGSWQYLFFLSKTQAAPSENEIHSAESSLSRVRADIEVRRREAANRRSPGESSWFSRVGASFRGGDGASQELQGLEALEYQMSRSLDSMRQRRMTVEFERTTRGKLFTFAGYLFTIYCIVRVFSATYNVVFLSRRELSNTTYSDIITHYLAYAISKSSLGESITREQIALFARQLSLLFVGIILLSSIRMILRGVTRVLNVTSRTLATSLMLLALTQIMSIYLLSTIVQMRASFPPPPSTSPEAERTNLFSTIPAYEVFGSLFDGSFLLAVAVSIFIRWGVERVAGNTD